MAERRRSRGRKMGSSRRLVKLQEEKEETLNETLSMPEEDSYISEIMEKIHSCFREDDPSRNMFVMRSDMEKVSSIIFSSVQELEQLFDLLDSEGKGYLTCEEFTSGLRDFIQSDNNPWNQKRKRKSKKRITEFPDFPSLEDVDIEERKQFMSFMEHLGANNIFEDETEIWKLWTRLAHDEPHLLENLEEFLAKVTSQIKEARKEKETLEMALKKRISEHTAEVDHLYEEMEQQMNAERKKLLHESDERSSVHSQEMKKVIEVKNKEVQQLVGVQDQLERELHKLKSTEKVTKTENEKLKRTNQDLEQKLEKIRDQLSETQTRLSEMRKKVNQHEHDKEKKDDDETMNVSTTQIFFQDPSQKNKSDETEQIKSEPIYQHESAEPVLEELSEIPSTYSNQRTRVISIEEDPVPDFLISDQNISVKNTGSESVVIPAFYGLHPLNEEEKYQSSRQEKYSPSGGYNSNARDPPEELLARQVKQQDVTNSSPSYPMNHGNSSEMVSAQNQDAVVTKSSIDAHTLESDRFSLDHQKALLHQTEKGKEYNVKGKKTNVDQAMFSDGYNQHNRLITYSIVGSGEDSDQKDVAKQIDVKGDSERYSVAKSKQDSPGKNKETPSEGSEIKESFQNVLNTDYVYKILFVGNTNVGKTSFLQRVHEGSYKRDTSATVGIDYRIKSLVVDNKRYILQLWDTAGQERFHSITEQFFRKADAMVIMYDVTSKDTFLAARYWLNSIKEKTEGDIVILLIGNKIDCDPERKVAPEEGEKLAQEYNSLFTECSVTSGINITESMRQLARSLKEREEYMKNNVVTIRRRTEKKNNICCV
ncbi:ras-related protein Rab-44-like isoform X2 [Spea bombifrons]|uniref:ras-related protein Rab-44-like isoform X2 n=1 Tax=Spea bombifrons TaxID=233779 RepID=UPI00234A4382|nr:ras-related protein Rab-44-like isoform X2 [Spea bombifrons]